MGSGNFTISAVSGSGPYTLTIDSSSGMTASDHIMSQLSDDTDALWILTTITDATTIVVTDSLTEGNGGSAFGAPVAGAGYYATPGTGAGLTKGPEGATGWRALAERNFDILDDLLTETGTQNLTLGAIGDGELVIRSSATLAGLAAYVVAQVVEDTGATRGADSSLTTAFVADDTVPTISEGSAIFSQAITPKHASSILVVESSVMISGKVVAIALYDNANACKSAALGGQSTDDSINTLSVSYQQVSGVTSALTFKVRGGTVGAGTAYLNSDVGTARFGDATIKSFLRITEYRPLGSP